MKPTRSLIIILTIISILLPLTVGCAGSVPRCAPERGSSLYDFTIVSGGKQSVFVGGEVGCYGQNSFVFSVLARSFELGRDVTLMPYKYEYSWKGKRHAKSINARASVGFDSKAKVTRRNGFNTIYNQTSGTANLVVWIYYQEVRICRNEFGEPISQKVVKRTTPDASKVVRIFW